MRIQNKDTAYKDQKIVLYRDKDNFPDDDASETLTTVDNFFHGEHVKPDDVPPIANIPVEQHDPTDLPF